MVDVNGSRSRPSGVDDPRVGKANAWAGAMQRWERSNRGKWGDEKKLLTGRRIRVVSAIPDGEPGGVPLAPYRWQELPPVEPRQAHGRNRRRKGSTEAGLLRVSSGLAVARAGSSDRKGRGSDPARDAAEGWRARPERTFRLTDARSVLNSCTWADVAWRHGLGTAAAPGCWRLIHEPTLAAKKKSRATQKSR